MSGKNESEWDRILSQRLSRESQSLPAAKSEDAAQGAQPAQAPQAPQVPQISQTPQAPPPAPPQVPFAPPGPHDGTVAFDSGSVASAAGNLREISAEGSVRPAPQGGQPGLPRAYGGITLGWAIGDNIAAVKEAQKRKAPAHTTIKTQDGLWSVAPAGAGGRRTASDPGMVVDELRKLTPQEEQRAFDILSGSGRGSRTLLVTALGLVAALASAGIAVAVHARILSEGELRLVAELAPPEERPPQRAAAEGTTPAAEPKVAAGDAKSPTPASTAGADQRAEPETTMTPPEGETKIETKPPEVEPKIVKSDARLVSNDGPTFSLGPPPPKREWVDIPGPALDFSDAPSVVDGDEHAP